MQKLERPKDIATLIVLKNIKLEYLSICYPIFFARQRKIPRAHKSRTRQITLGRCL